MKKILTGDVWGQVNRLLRGRKSKAACIAYVTSRKLKLRKGDTLICDASTFAVKLGETSAKTLQFYFRKGVKIYSNSSLHSKLLVTESFLVVGSSNLSRSSAEKLIESAIITDDRALNSQAKAFCYNLIEESALLTSDELTKLSKIKVVRRLVSPTKKSLVRKKEFGNQNWFIPVFPLGERAYEDIREKVESTTKSISKKEGLKEDDISFIRWPRVSKIAKESKEGDQLIVKFTNSNRTRSDIFPPCTLLKKEADGEFSILYYDDTNSDSAIPQTTFKKGIAKLGISNKSFSRTRKISESELNAIHAVWN